MKKSKRSQWMQGLLFAEEMIKKGYQPIYPFDCCGLQEWKYKDGTFAYKFANERTVEFGLGVGAYLQHHRERLQQC